MRSIAEPFQYEFFRNGLLVAVLSGGMCGVIGVYVVQRQMSQIGHGLSHSIFGGAAVSALISLNPYLGAGAWGMASALVIGRVSRRRIIGADAAIGVVSSASFALGVALMGLFGHVHKSIDATLFGSILGVSSRDLWVVTLTCIVVAGVIALLYRDFLFATFDPVVAAVAGLKTARLDAVMMLLLSAVVLVSMKVLGIVLIAATIVIPPTIARMVTSRFSRMLGLATVIGGLSALAGMIISYHADVSSGAAIVLVSAVLFTVVFGLTRGGSLHRTGRERAGEITGGRWIHVH